MTTEGGATEQAAGERAIFCQFARVSGLPIWLTSIESREPWEPDIRCEIGDKGPVAFELGEVVSEKLEKATSERLAARREFRTLYKALPCEDRSQIEACLGGSPAVFAGFAHDVPPGRWRRAVGPILTVLVERARATGHDRLAQGEIPTCYVQPLTKLLTDLGGPTERCDAVLRCPRHHACGRCDAAAARDEVSEAVPD